MTKDGVGSLGDVRGKKVMVRVDFNVRLNHKDEIIDDSKIQDALPTIKHLIDRKARVILVSHLGLARVDKKYSMKLLRPKLSELLKVEVKMADDCIGKKVEDSVAQLLEGEVLLLENVYHHEDEEIFNEPEFAKQLAALADLFVNDALAISHRKHASTVGVANILKPAVTGMAMEKELEYLYDAVRASRGTLAAIVGGSRLLTKYSLIWSLLDEAYVLLLGGGIIFPFYIAQGNHNVGSSLVASSREVEIAKSIIKRAKEMKTKIILPVDIAIADMFGPDANREVAKKIEIRKGWMGLDIGPKTIKNFCNALRASGTIIWNGPMGVWEYKNFKEGTEAIANKLVTLTKLGVKTIVIGDDTVAAVKKMGVANQMSHVSKGNHASVSILAGGKLPAVDVLDDDEVTSMMTIEERLHDDDDD